MAEYVTAYLMWGFVLMIAACGIDAFLTHKHSPETMVKIWKSQDRQERKKGILLQIALAIVALFLVVLVAIWPICLFAWLRVIRKGETVTWRMFRDKEK